MERRCPCAGAGCVPGPTSDKLFLKMMDKGQIRSREHSALQPQQNWCGPSQALTLRHSTITAVCFYPLRAPTTPPQALRLHSKHHAASTSLRRCNPHSATAAQRLTANRRIDSAADGLRYPSLQSAAGAQSIQPYRSINSNPVLHTQTTVSLLVSNSFW
jgi:hypothetical protein